MREELTLRATHRVDAWGTDINGHKPNVYQVDRDTLIEHFADFALEIRDEALRERDAQWREEIDWVRLSDDGMSIFTATEDSFGEGWNAALDSLKAKMESKQ